MSKLTPKEAFEHIKMLWTDTNKIKDIADGKIVEVLTAKGNVQLEIEMDWNGTVEYPLPEQKWRDAEWPRDAANPPKQCRVRQDISLTWTSNPLHGFDGGQWITGMSRWIYCQVVDDSEPVPAGETIKLLADTVAEVVREMRVFRRGSSTIKNWADRLEGCRE